MGLAADFGKSIVRGAGYSIGRNLVGGLGRNRLTTSYRERVADSYENKKINEKFERPIFDVLDEREENMHQTYKLKFEESNWECLSDWQKVGFFGWGFVAFCSLIYFNVKFSVIPFDGGLFNSLSFFGIPFIGGKLFIKFLHLIAGTKRIREKESNEWLDSSLKNLENLRKTYQEGIELVRNTWGEEFVKSYQNRIPKEGMHIEPFTLFFGKPDKEEITEKGKNLIYGTSKQAGDWFKFEDDYLKSFTIK